MLQDSAVVQFICVYFVMVSPKILRQLPHICPAQQALQSNSMKNKGIRDLLQGYAIRCCALLAFIVACH